MGQDINTEDFRGPDRQFMNTFCLRSVESGQIDAGGYDLYMTFIQANFTAGKATVDMSGIVRPGAKFQYLIFGETRTHVGSNATVNGGIVGNGQAILSVQNFTDAPTGITNSNILSATGKDGIATVMIIYNPRDHA